MNSPETATLNSGPGNAECSFSSGGRSQLNDCSFTFRRVDGPKAREIFISCTPSIRLTEAGNQAEAIYRTVRTILEAEAGSSASIASEIVFHRDLANQTLVRDIRRQVMGVPEEESIDPAFTEIEQPSPDQHVILEVSIQAVIPNGSSIRFEPVMPSLNFLPAEHCPAQGLALKIEGESRLYSGALYGSGTEAFQQTRQLFSVAEKMLQRAGMEFSDVVRTWIYLRDIERDYAKLNRARREFFEEREIAPPPASTGIGAGLIDGQDLCLSFYAVKAEKAVRKTLMTTPTLNEAPTYGADFSRGMRVVELNRDVLHVSGTASIDESGNSVHVDDLEAQAERMLLNISTLLEAQGAGIENVVSAITYLKYPEHAERLNAKLLEAGYEGFAHNLVIGPVCRPELLCESEVLAIVNKKPCKK